MRRRLEEVTVPALAPHRLEALIGPERATHLQAAVVTTQEILGGRTLFNLSSTATGGGVAEMLHTLLAYVRGTGVDSRWLVIEGGPEFFAITKRIHNGLYGTAGDGGPLGPSERRVYEATLAENAPDLLTLVQPGDMVLLHDPQPVGLADEVRRRDARVVWRCHVGLDRRNEYAERSWEFLRPYVERCDAYVFSREQFAPPWLPRDRLRVIPPSIDPFSAKNEQIDDADVRRILQHAGLLAGRGDEPGVTFTREDGSPRRINRHADVLQTGPPPPVEAPLVVQVSRWDRIKDMQGVMEGFASSVDGASDAHLILAGPSVGSVADDPEAGEVLDECMEAWRQLSHADRSRIHLACVPMRDVDEHATIVNALQRHCTVAVQKSIAEGFGLTVSEAMWKGRPVVASAVGGIVDQVVPGETGLLVEDPTDLEGFGAAVRSLLDDPGLARRLGTNGHQRVLDEFIGDRHLEQWASLLSAV